VSIETCPRPGVGTHPRITQECRVALLRWKPAQIDPRSPQSLPFFQLLLPPQHPRLVSFRLGLGNHSLLLIQDREAGVRQNVVRIDIRPCKSLILPAPKDLRTVPIGVSLYSWLRTCWSTHRRWPRTPVRGWQSKESDCKRFSPSDSGNSLLNPASGRSNPSLTHSPSSTAVSTPAPAPCFLPPRPREPFPSSDTGSRGWCAPECRRDRYPRFVGQLRWLRRSG
jgi:hypothetical protein